MPPRRVVFVTHTAARSGAELSILQLAQEWPDGCEAVLFEPGPLADDFRAQGVRVSVLRAPGRLRRVSRTRLWPALLAVPGLARLAWRLRAETGGCTAICASSQRALPVCAAAKIFTGKPLIWWLHDIFDHACFSRSAVRLQVRIANRFANAVVANSRVTREAFLAHGGRPEITRVIYYGMDARRFDNISQEETAQLRLRLGLQGRRVLGCFSRIAPWKGQHLLIECLPQLPDDVHLMLVGAPLFGEYEYQAALQRRASQLGVASRVSFLGFQANIPLFMKAADVVVHTSTAPEPFGRVVVEGMLAQRPVVAADCAGPREILEHGRTGILYEPGNPQALCDALMKVLDSPAETRAMVASAYYAALERFAMPRILAQWQALVEELCGTASH